MVQLRVSMPQSNLLISSLRPDDMSALKPLFRKAYLTQRTILFDQYDRIDVVYFPVTAVLSLLAGLSTGESIETAMIGNDGAVGLSGALDGKTSPSRCMVQVAGDALVCDAGAFK